MPNPTLPLVLAGIGIVVLHFLTGGRRGERDRTLEGDDPADPA